MPRENSFDVVSQVDLAEVDNAVNQAMKEVSQRYDFKGTGSRIELNKTERKIVLSTASEFTLQTLTAVLEQKLIRRKVSLKALEYGRIEAAAKDSVRQSVVIQMGIPIEKARQPSRCAGRKITTPQTAHGSRSTSRRPEASRATTRGLSRHNSQSTRLAWHRGR